MLLKLGHRIYLLCFVTLIYRFVLYQVQLRTYGEKICPIKTTPLCKSMALKRASERTGWFQARCGWQEGSISSHHGLGNSWPRKEEVVLARSLGAVGRGKDVCKLSQAHTGLTVGNYSQRAAASTWCEREGCSPSWWMFWLSSIDGGKNVVLRMAGRWAYILE
jgi:hypothetical protein